MEVEQLTGSSKRKRKSTVKHNVTQNEESDDKDNLQKLTKKIKRSRNDKGKGSKKNGPSNITKGPNKSANDATDNAEVESSENIDVAENTITISSENSDVIENDTIVNVTGAVIENINNGNDKTSVSKKKGKSKLSSAKETASSSLTGNQQCQNCTPCAEHKSVEQNSTKAESNSKMFACEICSGLGSKKIYNSLDKLKNHTKEDHEAKKELKFECTECPEPVWFPTKSKFCYHLGAKHPGIIKFVCEVCTQTFKLKANYKNHIKTHNITVEKKFSCDVCGGTFVNRAGFEAHKKRFPGPHIKQSCTHCGVSFSKEKHMKNHRCKILLLEEAAAERSNSRMFKTVSYGGANTKEKESVSEGPEIILEETVRGEEVMNDGPQENKIGETKIIEMEGTSAAEEDSSNKKTLEDAQSGKKLVFHRLLPKKNEKLIYRQFPLQTQNVPQSVVVQEVREIDLEGSAFITAEPDHQIILRDVNGHIVQGNQILQLDINEFQPGEESQVYLADWNVVAPFVIRGKSP